MVSAVCVAQSGTLKDLYLTKVFSNASFNTIHSETSHGNIEVSSGSGGDAKVEVFVQGRKNNVTLGRDEVQKLLDEDYALEISVSADVLKVIAHQKKPFINGSGSLSVSFKIYAGKDKSTDLETDHGNLLLSGMKGMEKLSTDHGNIDADHISGPLTAKTDHGNIVVTGSDDIDAKTDHGDIELKEGNGKISLVTSNGNIRITKAEGSIRTSTDHGNVAAEQIGGNLTASTSHGDIDLVSLSCSVDASTDHGNLGVSLDKITGTVTLNNSSGDINLELPKGNPVDLDLRGKRVVVKAIENFSGTGQNEYLKGSLNGGGPRVFAKTDKGQVDLAFK